MGVSGVVGAQEGAGELSCGGGCNRGLRTLWRTGVSIIYTDDYFSKNFVMIILFNILTYLFFYLEYELISYFYQSFLYLICQ